MKGLRKYNPPKEALSEEMHIALNEAADHLLLYSYTHKDNPSAVGLALYDALCMAYRIGREEVSVDALDILSKTGDI